jgi:uncharacterized protein YcfJ
MHLTLKSTVAACAVLLGTQAMAQITFYEGEGFRGRAMSTDRNIDNFDRTRFNDRISSVVVERGRWEVCEDARFRGRCVVLRKGNYDSLRSLGMQDRISSVRRVENNRRYENEPEPVAGPAYQWRQRPNERTYEVPVTSARAVVGPPNQRCWVERQQVQGGNQPNVGGAVIGGLIGGILGHQVGGGSGKDLATAGGAVAGAVIGANQGQGNTYPRDVQRCENVASTTPAYWDVTYNYRGVEHRVQMAAAPGATIVVNGNGEPRQ